MSKTHEQTQAQLDDMVAKMVDAGVRMPDATLLQKAGGRRSVLISCGSKAAFDGSDYKTFHGEIDEVLDAAFDYIAKIPDPSTAAKKAWQGKLGKVIDEGHALNLPDEVMTPLRQGSRAMTENLLTAPKSDQSEVA